MIALTTSNKATVAGRRVHVSDARPASRRGLGQRWSVRPRATKKTDNEAEGGLGGIKNLVKPKLASKPKADGGLKFNAPGLAKNVEVFTEWRATYKALKDFGLESIGAKDAAARVDAKTAVIVDVRTGKFYEKEHIEGSLSLPSYTKAKGVKGNLGKKLFLGSKTTEKNPDFASEAKSLLGDETRTIVLACTTGGTLKTEVERRDGKRDAYVDSQRAFGRDSLSLRAAKDLVDAGITNIAHLDGGIAAWKAEGLPVEGSDVGKERIEGLPWLGTAATYYGKKPKAPKKVDPDAWPEVFSSLRSLDLISVEAEEAYEMAQNGEAVILDVGTKEKYDKELIDGSVSLPFSRTVKTAGLKVAGGYKGLGSGEEPQERSPDFLANAKTLLEGETRMVILTCDKGGTLSTSVTSSKGRVFEDPAMKFGRESESLRACCALMEELGSEVKVAHLDGGKYAWKAARLPMMGAGVMDGESAVGWRVAVWFPGASMYFKGTVAEYLESKGTHLVQFDEDQGDEGKRIKIKDAATREIEVVLDQNRTIYLNRQGQSERNKILNRYPTGINALNDAKKKEKKLYLPYL